MKYQYLFKEPCATPILAAWHVLVRALLDGTATREELRAIEQAMVNVSKLNIWLRYRRHAKATDPQADPPEVKSLLEAERSDADLDQQWLDSGVVGLVHRAPASARASVMRSLAALIHDSDRLEALVMKLYQRPDFPEWARLVPEGGAAPAKSVKTSKPAATGDDNGLAVGASVKCTGDNAAMYYP